MEQAATETTESLAKWGDFEQQAFNDPEVQALIKEKADQLKRESIDREKEIPKQKLAPYIEPIQTPKVPDAGPDL